MTKTKSRHSDSNASDDCDLLLERIKNGVAVLNAVCAAGKANAVMRGGRTRAKAIMDKLRHLEDEFLAYPEATRSAACARYLRLVADRKRICP